MRLAVVLVAACAAAASWSHAQNLRAITEDGRKVILSPDGKWRFDASAPGSVTTPADTGSPYRTLVKKISFKFDTNSWVMQPRKDGADVNKRNFQHKSLPLYGMVIADEIPVSMDAMKGLIVANARAAGATTTVLIDETKLLGGKNVGFIRMAASLNGIDFMFNTNYYGEAEGNVQVTCYTAQSVFHKYQEDCGKFIAGLTID